MSEWKEYKLGDLVEVKYGKAHQNLKEGNIPAYGSGGFMRNVEKAIYDEESILIPRKGTLNNILYKDEPFWTVDTMFWTKIDKSKSYPKFLHYYLTLFDFANMNVGSAVPSMTVPVLNDIDILLPSLKEQTAIASVLSSLDDKIDLLHRQNKTLEQMAETLFRKWFVDGADEGWISSKILDVAEINNRTLKRDFPFATIEYLDTGSITNGEIERYQLYDKKEAPSRAQRIVKDNDIVYSVVRPIQRHFGMLYDVKENTIVSTGFTVISCTKISPHYIYYLLKQSDVIEYLDMVAEGSTSAYPSLRPSDIANFEFQIPDQEKLDQFHNITEENWKKIKSNTKQIQSLTNLRDTLLPKLMSGEVKVKM